MERKIQRIASLGLAAGLSAGAAWAVENAQAEQASMVEIVAMQQHSECEVVINPQGRGLVIQMHDAYTGEFVNSLVVKPKGAKGGLVRETVYNCPDVYRPAVRVATPTPPYTRTATATETRNPSPTYTNTATSTPLPTPIPVPPPITVVIRVSPEAVPTPVVSATETALRRELAETRSRLNSWPPYTALIMAGLIGLGLGYVWGRIRS